MLIIFYCLGWQQRAKNKWNDNQVTVVCAVRWLKYWIRLITASLWITFDSITFQFEWANKIRKERSVLRCQALLKESLTNTCFNPPHFRAAVAQSGRRWAGRLWVPGSSLGCTMVSFSFWKSGHPTSNTATAVVDLRRTTVEDKETGSDSSSIKPDRGSEGSAVAQPSVNV